MFGYYLQLAWRSIKKTPVMSALMVLALGVGVAIVMTMLTLQHVESNNALAAKNEQLFYLQLNSSPSYGLFFNSLENGLPPLVTYRTATTLLKSKIANHSVAMFRWLAVLSTEDASFQPKDTVVRVTSRDFFGLFDVPFIYGQQWDEQADESAKYQVVIDQTMNQQLFGGGDSVGKTLLLQGKPYQIVGVTNDFLPVPSVHDLSMGKTAGNTHIYVPFGLVQAEQLDVYGQRSCESSDANQRVEAGTSSTEAFEIQLQNLCIWLQFWVELPDAETKARYVDHLQQYFNQQKKHGFFARDFAYALSTPEQWLQLNHVVSTDTKVSTWLAVVFLLICVVNTVALLTAKLWRQAPEAGIRQALGASRGAIFVQNLVEAGFVGLLGGVFGIILSQVMLMVVRSILANNSAMMLGTDSSIYSTDGTMLAVTVLVALISSVLAGLYPAWHVSRTQPAYYLKIQ